MSTEQQDVKPVGRKGRRRVVATQEQAKEVAARLKAGTAAHLLAESRRLGFSHNMPLRMALRELLGREEYDALMSAVIARSRGPRRKKTTAAEQQ